MFGKILLGAATVLVLGVGGFMYLTTTEPNGLPASCPSRAASTPSASCDTESTSSCCSSGTQVARVSACCETTESCPACPVASEAAAFAGEELTVLPREVR